MRVSSYQFCSILVITGVAFAVLADPMYAQQRGLPQDQLKKLLTNVKEIVTSKRNGLLLRGEGQKGPLSFEGYDPAKVVEGIVLGKSQLLESLNTKELSGLRGYVAKYYPTDLGLKVVVSPTCRFYASIESTNAAYKRVEDFIGKLQSVTDRIAVNLTINSEPSEAQFEVYSEIGNSRSGTSRAEFTNLYRGFYSYKVVKEGYKTITGELNLVDEVGTLLDCKLFPVNAKDRPSSGS